MVAGNGGRPGGAVGDWENGTAQEVHANHATQEEDIVSAWLSRYSSAERNEIYKNCLHQKWGLTDPTETSTSTYQGVDYTDDTNRASMYADAWVVEDVEVCTKKRISNTPAAVKVKIFNTDELVKAALVFVAGPNSVVVNGSTGSTTRTLNPRARDNYRYFKEGVRQAVRTGLNAMIVAGLDVAYVARVSGGIYAGDWKYKINEDFVTLLNGLLREKINTVERGRYFKKVFLVDLAR
jgi:hypothetical protein